MDVILGRLMLAFRGRTVPGWLATRLAAAPAAGFTLFRPNNVTSPAQVRALTTALQEAARDATRAATGEDLPLLIATDQEGGQLLALGASARRAAAVPTAALPAAPPSAAASRAAAPGRDWTPFPGPMAIGATGDADLAERVGRAIGLELRAVGVNVDYAPDLDVATDPANPSIGIRSFGDDPEAVARLAGAWLRGLQSAGVAATGKHFPGAGGLVTDTHHGLGVLTRSRADLDAVELVPFRAAVAAGVRLVMSGHFAVPALTGDPGLPATLSGSMMTGLLRDELGFEGVSITDALDMRAIPQGAAQARAVTQALEAGVDLLLATADRTAQRRIEAALRRAAASELLDPAAVRRSDERIRELRRWLGGFEQPPLAVVGSAEHRALAREVAARALTLVRDDARVLPLRLAAGARIAAIMPTPRDLTPADTSSYVEPSLAAALRGFHDGVDEIVTSHPPGPEEIASIRERARSGAWDAVVVGTISASARSAQASLAAALLSTDVPVVTVALRTPWDIAAYPGAGTHVATYSILRESMDALAAALFGHAGFPGRLPVRVDMGAAA